MRGAMLTDFDYALTCADRLGKHSALYSAGAQAEATTEAWENFVYWLDRWKEDRIRRNLPVAEGFIPMCNLLKKELKA